MQQKINILLIEGNKSEQRTISSLLEGAGLRYNILKAESLIDGLEFMIHSAIDIILLDLDLPESGGYKTLQRIVETNKQIPVIVITGSYNSIIESLSIKAGAQEYLTKEKLTQNSLSRAIQNSYLRNAIVRKLISQNEELNLKIKKQDEALAVSCSAYWTMDLVNNEMSWSKTLFQMFGIRNESVTPTLGLYLKYVHPDERETVQQWFNNIPALPTKQEISHKLIFGKTISHVRLSARFCLDHKTQPLSIIGTIQEISPENNAPDLTENNIGTESDLKNFIDSLIQDVESSIRQVQQIQLTPEHSGDEGNPRELMEQFHLSVNDLRGTLHWLNGLLLVSGHKSYHAVSLLSVKSLLRKTEKLLGRKNLEKLSESDQILNAQVEYSPAIFELLLRYLKIFITKVKSNDRKAIVLTSSLIQNEIRFSFAVSTDVVTSEIIKELQSGISDPVLVSLSCLINESKLTIRHLASAFKKISSMLNGFIIIDRSENLPLVNLQISLKTNIHNRVQTTNGPVLPDSFRILIADDHFLTRLSTKKNIQNQFPNAVIEEAENGEQAYSKALKNRHDIILMDLSMPEMDGISSMLEIRKVYNPFIIALATEENKADSEQSTEGFNDILYKPFTSDELIESISRLTQNLLFYSG